MPTASENIEKMRRVLVESAQFEESLVTNNYHFGNRKIVPLAGFAYRPMDARSICVGVVTSDARMQDLTDYRELGAPLLLKESDERFDLWKVGATAEKDARVVNDLSIDGVGNYFALHSNTLIPHRIYEAKTFARVHPAKSGQPNLFAEFVDPDLLSFVETTSGDLLTQAVVDSIRGLVKEFAPERWTIEVVFRLLAGKILRDKDVPGFKSITLSNVEDILRRVEKHYGSQRPVKLSKKKVKSLVEVMERIQELGDFRNLTTESLGDVYEQALITKDIRKIHGTHKTPSYLVDYIVWQLAKWIDEIPVDELRFFEPGCGHAPFLVSAMRALRVANVDVPDLSEFFRERFLGIDNDPFALEIARLSLTLADEPNPNGWIGLKEADMFEGDLLEQTAAQATVMLTNPPYEKRRAEELLYRTLPQLPVGALFAAVVPATLMFAGKPRARKLRQWITENCQLSEVDLFPDGLFTFADQEIAILIGRVLSQTKTNQKLQCRFKRVRDTNVARSAFRMDYQFSTTRQYPQSVFQGTEDTALWLPEFDREVWQYLRKNQPIRDIADIGKGFEHKGQKELNRTVASAVKFAGSEQGYSTAKGDWCLHEGARFFYVSTKEEDVGVKRRGLDRVPQVLVNYAPVGRGQWRLKPFIDRKGRPYLTRFLCIRPKVSDFNLEYIWALLISPVAALYVWSHLLKRDILPSKFEMLPVPNASERDVKRISKFVTKYFELVNKGEADMFNSEGYQQSSLHDALLAIDAEVLRLYKLPAKSERLLLDQFRGEQRPGIPIPFTEYYPAETKLVPLHAFRSKVFQRGVRGSNAELSEQEITRYEELTKQADVGCISNRDAESLHRLQAEVDGRDYWQLKGRQIPALDSETSDDFDERLRRLGERAVSMRKKKGSK